MVRSIEITYELKRVFFTLADCLDALQIIPSHLIYSEDALARGVAGEICLLLMLGERPTYTFYLDKQGDGGFDYKGYDVKVIYPGQELMLYPNNIDNPKSKGFIVIEIDKDMTYAGILGRFPVEYVKERCYKLETKRGWRYMLNLDQHPGYFDQTKDPSHQE